MGRLSVRPCGRNEGNIPKANPFDEHVAEYEQWFVHNRWAYQSELAALKKVLPQAGKGMEIGVGSGLFAAPLGIRDGVDPSPAMRARAAERGIRARAGVAENLPCADGSYDYVLMVTTVCFVDDALQSFREAHRVLKVKGTFIVGFVDSESPLGKVYMERKERSVFYRDAVFFSSSEIRRLLHQAGFTITATWQTVFGQLDEIQEVQEPEKGQGKGSFIVIQAGKNEAD